MGTYERWFARTSRELNTSLDVLIVMSHMSPHSWWTTQALLEAPSALQAVDSRVSAQP